jgi:hypothetical protein
MDILGSSLWPAIGVLVAITFGIITIILTFVQVYRVRSRKIFAYDIVSNASVVTVNKEVKSRVKILLDNNPIENARLVVIEVLNGGDVPIQTTDYENNMDIVFDFGAGAEVLNIALLEMNPKSLKPSLSFKSEQVLLRPLLLNSQDSFKFKALVTSFKGDIKIEGRISGVKEIITFDGLPRDVRRKMLERVGLILAFVGFIGYVVTRIIGSIYPYSAFSYRSTDENLLMLLFICMMVTPIITIFLRRIRKT